MAVGILRAVSAMVSHVSRKVRGSGERRRVDASKIAPSWGPYLSRRISLIPFRGRRNRKIGGKVPEGEEENELSDEEGEEREGGLWQKGIMMGEKCQPLEFSGAIFYDCEGRRLPTLPPKSPHRGHLVPGGVGC
ncbi:unnamed protein product [Spirodela intermedia]|uniref:Uncharacterized protein n=2 Tax=Spirodela intermedia TaxID=51605 RepID=A0A7I8ITP6_SPIIN|nr:unnamed protein product [Spirodela intermedia]CAA6661245.1 unnamed protein product [Spirodela intermedia]CAA7397605.1 unnamed protein product [Spirodela intermedia]